MQSSKNHFTKIQNVFSRIIAQFASGMNYFDAHALKN